jgi:hypothetical protein
MSPGFREKCIVFDIPYDVLRRINPCSQVAKELPKPPIGMEAPNLLDFV